MTAEETAQFYQAREAYRRKCEDFKEQMFKYLSNYETKECTIFKGNTHTLFLAS